MKSRTTNMTTGNPVNLLLLFAFPMLIGNIFQQLYNLIDSIIVGRFVGADALAAVGSTGSITFLFFALCSGITGGGGIVTAQIFGKGDDDNVKKSIANAAYLTICSSILVCCISLLLSAPLLRLLGTPAEIMDNALVYLRMMCICVPLMAIYNYAAAMLRALGDSKTPLYFLIFACFFNAGMDVVFVYGFKMGVFGAALATLISQVIAGVGCLLYAIQSNAYFKLERKHFELDIGMIKNAVRIGVPLSLQYAMIAVSTMALQRVVNSFGPTAMAAYTATGRVEQLLHQPYSSLSMALSTFSGQNKGAGNLNRVRLGYRKSLVIMGAFSLFMLPVMLIFGNVIIGLFVKDAEVIRLGGTALRITSWFYLALGTIYVTRGMLNGVGDALFAFINGIVEMVGRIVLPVVITMIPFIGIWGIWWSSGLTWLISALFCVLRYFSWRKACFSPKSSYNLSIEEDT